MQPAEEVLSWNPLNFKVKRKRFHLEVSKMDAAVRMIFKERNIPQAEFKVFPLDIKVN